ncbi:hypothetical protein BDZ94DRAFT_1256585 [Collybia nuda]|uniref:Uncharacterized protein n=1 Tax=Collybia nuda TaxID=64659 RepID=A0A9P6CL83_9AGAR|nr:hypothetical protein BDZ94DRAFT_1256585 [Collybia nuda]
MDPTAKFRNALPYAVLPVSPTLAALHATTGRGKEWCLKCGSHLLSGNAEIQVIRMKNRKRALPLPRLLRKTCRGCGWSNDTPFTTRPPPSVSQTSSAGAQSHNFKTLVSPSPLAAPPTQKQLLSSSVLHPPTQPKQRSKKRTGLQEMLSLNRQKAEAKKESKGQIGGLATFLSGL